jgi:hypothetical protein
MFLKIPETTLRDPSKRFENDALDLFAPGDRYATHELQDNIQLGIIARNRIDNRNDSVFDAFWNSLEN